MVIKAMPRLESKAFDIIGDVHGCGDALHALLEKLGYRKANAGYQQPGRKVIFLGDIVDRGPQVREAVETVRAMVEQHQAVMVLGNHEYNLLAYFTPSRREGGGFVRPRTQRNQRQLAATLEAFADDERALQDYLQWLKLQPLLFENSHLRVVHACWDKALIKQFSDEYPQLCADDDFLVACDDVSTTAFKVKERLLNGMDMRLPDDQVIHSRDGHIRRYFRIKFWLEQANHLHELVFQPDPLPDDVHHHPIPAEKLAQLLPYSVDQVPLFLGHYWQEGEPVLQQSNICCLDYSAVNGGKLVAYQFDIDQPRLSNDNFVWVDAR